MTADAEPIWTAMKQALRATVKPDVFDLWLAPLRPAGLAGDTLVLEAPAPVRAFVAERCARALQRAAHEVLGPGGSVDVRAEGEKGPAPSVDAEPTPARLDPDGLNPKFTFDQFVIGDANRFAHGAALAVAELPGQAYNPLFIYGPPGVGKTHLLHSIGNYVNTYGSGLTVRYVTAETFTNQFVASVRKGGDTAAFKGRYRHSDVLLIDDVQFLASKGKTEEEFFHTFNALHDAGAQLVLTSDRLPRDIEAVADRLRARFEAGLVTAITPPDLRTRLTVLRMRAQHDGVQLAEPGVLELLADRVPHNIRALEGALIRVVAFSSLAGRPLTVALAQEVLDDLYPQARARGAGTTTARPTIGDVQELCAEAFGLTLDELLSANRSPAVAWPRQVAMYLAREHTGETLPAIGAGFGGRNHTTVLHACRRATDRLASDPDAFEIVRRLTDALEGTSGPSGATDRLR